ncbi:CBS domain-containing protein [Maribius pontilimi]|uniref:CBS domain-containing protein n=1 Tax=Palleronia pontilimi TaxID=1964209 RepID=A0A934MGF5_9RHOB|nr:transporter associated domain-containing protein [Palleronia pontilimi]MBJ3762349.1 CBS domain-containing protein [Palleronia pontilimi]
MTHDPSGPDQVPAQADDEDSPDRGFFGRIFDAFTPTEGEEEEDADNGARPTRLPPGLLNLRRMRVEDVSIPSIEIVSVPVDIEWDALVQVFKDSGMTRLPVYEGTLDSPIGLVHLKDFALRHGFGSQATYDLRAMLRPLIYAPPSMPIGVLLQKMQQDRMHMALVIDEYGGVDGLVTIEDLIEQVLGQIEDEHDTEEDQYWTVEKGGSYLAQAKTPLDDFEEEIGMRLVDPEEEEEVDTLGGLVVLLTGRVPTRGEVVPHPAGPEFEIVDADPRRLKRLRVRVPDVDAG